MIHSILDSNQYCFTQDSIQNIIQFIISSGNSIQKIIQFDGQGIIDTGRVGKVPKNHPKSVQNRQKGGFSSKMAKIDSKHDSFIHFMKNSIQRILQYHFFQEYTIQKVFQDF